MKDKSKEIEALIDKAAAAHNSEDAVRFSQAACNAAQAMHMSPADQPNGSASTPTG